MANDRKTVWYELDTFPDKRYMLLLAGHVNNRNIRLFKDGELMKVDGETKFTVCLTTSDIKTLGKAPRVYNDINGLNNDFIFMSEKRLFKRGKF